MLTEQRKRFVEELMRLHGANQKQAAINAGYSPKSAASQASQVLKDPKVREYYESLKAAQIREIWAQLELMSLEAVQTLYAVLINPEAQDKDRLKAATEILDRAGFRSEDRNNQAAAAEELPKLLHALQEGST